MGRDTYLTSFSHSLVAADRRRLSLNGRLSLEGNSGGFCFAMRGLFPRLPLRVPVGFGGHHKGQNLAESVCESPKER